MQLQLAKSGTVARSGRRKALHRGRKFFRTVTWFAPYMRPRAPRLLLTLMSALGVTAMRLAEPWPLKLIIDTYFFGLDLPRPLAQIFGAGAGNSDLLLIVLALSIVVIAALGGLFYYLQRLFTSALALEATSRLRLDLYTQLQRLSIGFHQRRRLGETLMRLTGDVRALRETFVSLPVQLTADLLLMAGMIAIMLAMNWQLAIFALALLPALFLMAHPFGRSLRRASTMQRRREGTVAAMAAESLAAVKVIQAFRGEERARGRFADADLRAVQSGRGEARLSGKVGLLATAAVGIGTGAVIGFASYKVIRGAMTPGDLVVFLAYLKTFFQPLRELSGVMMRLARATVAGDRLIGVLKSEPDVKEAPDAKRAPRFRGDITLENVSVAFAPGRSVLNGVDLDIRAGERMALLGPTGAGKSTLASLIPRFFDPTAGAVKIDGVDLRRYRLASLRGQIAIVFQEPILFSMSVADNIAYGKDGATREEIVAAARSAGVLEVIEELPDGMDTIVGERASRLSGGQRQCVAIARAMIRDARIVILDEPTTGLDPALTATVMSALDRLTRGKTVIMITHDHRLIRPDDRIVALQKGQIVHDGVAAGGFTGQFGAIR